MTQATARMLLFALLAVPAFALTAHRPPAGVGPAGLCADGKRRPERVVYVAGGLSDEQLIQLTATLAACGDASVLLIDSHEADAQQHFLAAYRPTAVVAVGWFADGLTNLERRLGTPVTAVIPWQRGQPARLWESLFPRAREVVVCPGTSRRLLLQAACLAGSLGAPLYVTADQADEASDLQRRLDLWRPAKIYMVGGPHAATPVPRGVPVVRLRDEQAVADLYLRRLRRTGPVQTVVVTNPADRERRCSPVSALAARVALRRRAVLLMTNPAGDNVNALVRAAVRRPGLHGVEAVLLLADLEAIPMEQRPNPIRGGKEKVIEMEPLTPTGSAAFSFATGRLFHPDPGMLALVLARQQLLASRPAGRKALVVSNATGSLPLLETFSRNTVKELCNRGYETTALFGESTDKDEVRRLLPENDIFLWEGHYTALKEYGVPDWTEPLPPSLVVLQSCLALNTAKALPLLERGGVSVVGSPNRIYSSAGGAFTLAFFDALLYDRQTVGSSLRHAKNFLLAYSLLKQKRLGPHAKLSAADVRSAWLFALWGDPTLRLPAPAPPEDALPAVRHAVHGNTIALLLPREAHDKTVTARYCAQILPNGRLGGLVRKGHATGGRQMLSLVFAEVHLPHAVPGKMPQLSSRLPGRRYVFCWDERRRTGYLLASPRDGDRGELRFHVRWVRNTAAQTATGRPECGRNTPGPEGGN